MRVTRREYGFRWLMASLLLVLATLPASAPDAHFPLRAAGCAPGGSLRLAPTAGRRAHRALARIAVPGAEVDLAGGNLLLQRTDLTLETRLGARAVTATWNAADRAWIFGFDLRFDGAELVDASGAAWNVTDLAPGQAIPGTPWVYVDGATLRSKGGLVHAFGADGRLARIHWTSAPYPALVYTTAPFAGGPAVVRVEQCTAPGTCTPVFDVARDAAGRVLAVEDRAGRRAEYAWDAAGQLVVARDPLDVAEGRPGTRYAYQGGLMVERETSEAERVAYRYTDGRVTQVEALAEEHPRWSFGYGAASGGLYAGSATLPTGEAITVRYDAAGRVHERVDGAGDVTSLTWVGLRPASLTRPDGGVIAWEWVDDVPVRLTAPDGSVTGLGWQPGGENREAPFEPALAAAWDALGPIAVRGYDAAGRLVAIANGEGETFQLTWGSDDLLASVTDPSGRTLRLSGYGEHGRPTRVESPAGSAQLVYDAVGDQVGGPGVDPLTGPEAGTIAARSFDAGRHLAGLTLVDFDADATRELRVRYRSDGKPLAIERPYGGDAVFSYDGLGRLVERRDRVAGSWYVTAFRYDALGRLLSRERPNGMREEWDYDRAGRPVAHRILGAAGLEDEELLTWREGLLVARDDAAAGGTETLAYDAAGRPVRITYADGGIETRAYDARGRLSHRAFEDTLRGFVATIDLALDRAGRITAVRHDGATLLEHVFADGRLVRTSYGNGLVRSYGYSPATGTLAWARLIGPAGQLVEDTAVDSETCVAFLPACYRQQTTVSGAFATSIDEVQVAERRLGSGTVLTIESSTSGGTFHGTASVLDALANTTERQFLVPVSPCGQPEKGQRFLYDAERTRLLERRWIVCGTTAAAYAWDAAGFATSRAGEAIAWDGGGRPVAVGSDLRFQWDAAGRPVLRALRGTTTRLRFGGVVEADPGGAPRAIDLGEVRIRLGGGGPWYRHADFRENGRLVTDAAGAVLALYEYDGYGTVAVHGADVDPAHRFAGGLDLGDGLVLLGRRLFDSDARRFLAPDPAYAWVGQHTYTLGDPVHYWDPGGATMTAHGLAFGVAGAIGAGLGYAVGSSLVPIPVVGGVVGGFVGRLVMAGLANLIAVAIDPAGPRLTFPDLLQGSFPLMEPSAGGSSPSLDFSFGGGPFGVDSSPPAGPFPPEKDFEIHVDPTPLDPTGGASFSFASINFSVALSFGGLGF